MDTWYMIRKPDSIRPAIADVSPMAGLAKDQYFINRINVPEKLRGQGMGSELLKMILKDADQEKVTLILYPAPSGGLNFLQLSEWYERYNFVWNEVGSQMIRLPQ